MTSVEEPADTNAAATESNAVATTEETPMETSTSEEIPLGNPDDLTKNPDALKEANEEMATLDVLVCGKCHTVFHFLEQLQEHKAGETCTRKSPVKDSNESKAQVWAFLLWKCSSIHNGSSIASDSSWKLYQQWCRMPEAQRTAWITAGASVQELSKFAHAKVMELKSDDQQVPVTTPERKRGRPRKVKTEDSEYQPSGEESDVPTKLKKVVEKSPSINAAAKAKQDLLEKESLRNAQEKIPAEERIARRTENEGASEANEFIVEKILAKRFNPRRKQYEYLLKWEGLQHEQNTWEPIENLNTCKSLVEAFEKQLARQKELKALRAQQQTTAQGKPSATPINKQPKKPETPLLTPSGRLQRSSKARAMEQVKSWVGGVTVEDRDEPAYKRLKKEETTDDEFSEPETNKVEKKVLNGSPKANLDPELAKQLGLGGKGMPNIKGVIKVDPKHMPNLSTGVYIMSKSSGIMKIDSPGKLGPGLNIDQNEIRKQILAAKQKKVEETKTATPVRSQTTTQVKKTLGTGGQQVTEKTIITPSGQKIIQRTIHRTTATPEVKSPVNLLNKKIAQSESMIRGSTPGRGRGRGAYTVTSGGNIVRLRDNKSAVTFDMNWDASSDSSDGIEDPFPKDLGPIPSPSPERELTLDPETGKRLARAEGEPTPPPTPSPPPTPPPAPVTQPMLMKVEMSPGGTTGLLVQQGGDGTQTSLPVLTDEDGNEVKVESSAVKQLLTEGVGVDEAESEEVNLLGAGHPPIMIRGEDGVLYQVAGENEDGQTLLVAAEGMEGATVEGENDSENVMYVTREEDGQDVLSIEPTQLSQLMPNAGGAGLQQVAVQVEGDGDEPTQVIAQLVQADLPSPGGTRRVVLLLPDGSFTMTELDKDQYEAIMDASKAQD